MSCIAYVCECMFKKTLTKFEVDFENEWYVSLPNIDRTLYRFEHIVPEISDFFIGKIYDVLCVYDGEIYDVLCVYDGETYFLLCSKCLLKLFNAFDIYEKCYIKNHDEYIPKLLAYLYERIDQEISGEYIFHFWDLCKDCIVQICHELKSKFSAVFHVKVLS